MKYNICGQEFPALTSDGKCRICIEKEQGFINIQMTDEYQLSPRVVEYSEPIAKRNLLNPDEIIIKEELIKIEFTYPLSNEVIFKYRNKGGFSRMDLWNCIYDGYKRIYEEEEKEVGDPGTAPNLMNRAESYGKYGIWGHQIGELYIERVLYNKSRKTIKLRIGS